jgi:hypothetical protein
VVDDLCRRDCRSLIESGPDLLSQPLRLVPGRENSIELATHDDWSRYGIACKRDIGDLFVPNFYFACEPHAPNERGDTVTQTR